MFDWLKKEPAAPEVPDRTSLVPRIKNLHFRAALKGMKIPEDQIPYTVPLAADLLVTFAFDLPSAFQMASKAAIAELGISLQEARKVAVDNLRQRLPQIGFADYGVFSGVETGENLEACTLLARPFWEMIAAETEEDVVVAVPSRDSVLFCSSESADGIAAMREFAAEVFEGETTHGLTERLLVWRGNKWAEFQA